MANQNFRVKTGLEVGTGVTISAGIVTAAKFVGDGSGLLNIIGSQWVTTNAGIHTLSNVGIGTTNPTSKLTVKGNTSLETLNVSGVSTFNGGTYFKSSTYYDENPVRAYFGNLSELSIYTTGTYIGKSYNYIDADSGYLDIRNYKTTIRNPQVVTQRDLAIFDSTTFNAEFVKLYYGGNEKFATIGAGVTVTGTTFTNQLSVSGVSTLSTLQVGTGGTTITTTIGGLVGIGTTNPTKLLTVGGDALINGLTIGQGPSVYSSNAGNVVLGTNAFASNQSGTGNIAIGYSALTRHQSGNNNTAVGNYALNGDTSVYETGYDNTAVGSLTLYSNRFGAQNTAIGKESLYTNIDGTNNVAVGYRSLYSNTSGGYNSAFGYSALNLNSSGFNNTAVGNQALYSNNDGLYNTAVGDSALLSNSSGSDNAAIGYQALNASNGNYNIAAGNYALRNNTSGNSNTGVGAYALDNNNTGGYNVGVGYKALSGNTSGTYNVAIGWNAGVNLSGAGRYNVLIGPCGSTIFTPTAVPPIADGSNQLVIGAGNTAWIYGNSSYNVGIGTTNPTSKLDVVNSGVSGSVIRSRVTTNNGGYLAYEALNSSGTSVFSVTHNGRINLSENIVFASGQGIDFSATPNSSGTMTSELLSDYEEGTWTPIFQGGTSNPTVTYVYQNGWYTKIGNIVYITVILTTSAVSGGSGDLRIGGLPFSADTSGYYQIHRLNLGEAQSMATAITSVIVNEEISTTQIFTDGTTASLGTGLNNNRIRINGWYKAT